MTALGIPDEIFQLMADSNRGCARIGICDTLLLSGVSSPRVQEIVFIRVELPLVTTLHDRILAADHPYFDTF